MHCCRFNTLEFDWHFRSTWKASPFQAFDLCTNARWYSWNKFNYFLLEFTECRVVNAWRSCFLLVLVLLMLRREYSIFTVVRFITIPDSNHKNVLTKIFHSRISIMMHVIPLEFPFRFAKWCAEECAPARAYTNCATIFSLNYIEQFLLRHHFYETKKGLKRKKKLRNITIHLCVELWIWVRLAGAQIISHNMAEDGRMAVVWRGNDKKRNDEWSGNVYNRYPVEMVINQFSWRKSVSAPSFKGTRAKIKYTEFFSYLLVVRTRDTDTMLCFLLYTFLSLVDAPFLCGFFTLLLYCKKIEEIKKKMSHGFSCAKERDSLRMWGK